MSRSWSRAEKLAGQMDEESLNRKIGIMPDQRHGGIEIKEAAKHFFAAKSKANPSDATLASYQRVLETQSLRWCKKYGLWYLDQLTSDALLKVDELWTEWPVSNDLVWLRDATYCHCRRR